MIISSWLVVQGLIVYYIIQRLQWAYSETLLKLHTIVAIVIITTQKILDRTNKDEGHLDNCNDCFILVYFSIVLTITFRFTHVISVMLIVLALYAFYADSVAKSI